MFPNKPEWKSWNAIEKATYIAQLLAPLTLLFTVIFAWLGWQEARHARLDQTKYFLSQNAPEVKIVAIKIVPNLPSSKGILTFVLRNIGGSTAKKVCLTLFKVGSSLEKEAYRNSCMDSDIFSNLTIPKDCDIVLPLLKVEDLEADLGFLPINAEIYSFGESSTEINTVGVLAYIYFEGSFSDSYHRLNSIAFAK